MCDKTRCDCLNVSANAHPFHLEHHSGLEGWDKVRAYATEEAAVNAAQSFPDSGVRVVDMRDGNTVWED